MPTKTWEPPPEQQDRETQPVAPDADQPRNLDTRPRPSDVNDDVRNGGVEYEHINTHGSER
jgi:hypothetical protein